LYCSYQGVPNLFHPLAKIRTTLYFLQIYYVHLSIYIFVFLQVCYVVYSYKFVMFTCLPNNLFISTHLFFISLFISLQICYVYVASQYLMSTGRCHHHHQPHPLPQLQTKRPTSRAAKVSKVPEISKSILSENVWKTISNKIRFVVWAFVGQMDPVSSRLSKERIIRERHFGKKFLLLLLLFCCCKLRQFGK